MQVSFFAERCGDLETSIGEVRDLWETGSGQVQQMLPELLEWLESHGLEPGQTLDEKHPHKAVHDAHRYLQTPQWLTCTLAERRTTPDHPRAGE